ncbi:MAG: hypothetical protein J7L26_12685 [Candidatus Aminicenantes bacterium]|nr:hypothetical protein [Candidatus Aminicenantes bacterium]
MKKIDFKALVFSIGLVLGYFLLIFFTGIFGVAAIAFILLVVFMYGLFTEHQN